MLAETLSVYKPAAGKFDAQNRFQNSFDKRRLPFW